ncbi:MAG: chemotaxis protein CheA, partial [Oligoflexales bacterium]|nr:chemotaxis protein CheA [Oligoflexales bacterium]
REHLDQLEIELINIEANGSSDANSVINSIFRHVHTIKGGASSVGMKSIEDLAHAMENILYCIKKEKMEFSLNTINLLIEGADLLRFIINNPGEDVAEKKKRLKDLFGVLPLSTRVDEAVVSKNSGYQTYFENQDGGQGVLSFDNGSHKSESGQVLPKNEICDIDKHEETDPSPNDGVKIFQNDIEGQKQLKEQAHSETVQNRPDMSEEGRRQTGETISGANSDEKQKKDGAHSNRSYESVRVRIDLLDKLMILAGELVLIRNQYLMTTDRNNPKTRTITQRIDSVTSKIQETVMQTRMEPVANLFNRIARIVRDLSIQLGKNINVNLIGKEVELDRSILEALSDPIVHIIRNACDHGIEEPHVRVQKGKNPHGQITVKAFHSGGQINIQIIDDGQGIDIEKIKAKAVEKRIKTESDIARMTTSEMMQILFIPGFSSKDKVTNISGRGVGMDVVRESIGKLRGSVDLSSKFGEGSTVTLKLPLTLAIIPSLIISSSGYKYALPQTCVEEAVSMYAEDVFNKIEIAGNLEVYRLRNQLLTLIRLDEILKRSEPFSADVRSQICKHYLEERRILHKEYKSTPPDEINHKSFPTFNFVVIHFGDNRYGLVVDKIFGVEEIVVSPMHSYLKTCGIFAGATIMGDGQIALILDPVGVAKHTQISFLKTKQEICDSNREKKEECGMTHESILIFKSGPEEQFAMELSKIRRVEKISITQIEKIGTMEFIKLKDNITRLIRIDKYLNVSPCVIKPEMFLVFPRDNEVSFAIMASELIDIDEFSYAFERNPFMSHDGIVGTANIENKITVFVSFDYLKKNLLETLGKDENKVA